MDYNIKWLDQWTRQPFYKSAAFPDWLREAELVFLAFSVSGGNSWGSSWTDAARCLPAERTSLVFPPHQEFDLLHKLLCLTDRKTDTHTHTHTHRHMHTQNLTHRTEAVMLASCYAWVLLTLEIKQNPPLNSNFKLQSNGQYQKRSSPTENLTINQ